MTESSEREKMIRRIEALPGQLQDAVRGLSDAQLDTPYRGGGWTVRQVVHHLADSHLNAFVRTKLILTEERPTLKPYSQDAWSTLADASLPIAPSLEILSGLHRRWVALLRSIPEADWSRPAFHPERGEVTPESMLAMYAGHGENHVAQIRSLREARRW